MCASARAAGMRALAPLAAHPPTHPPTLLLLPLLHAVWPVMWSYLVGKKLRQVENAEAQALAAKGAVIVDVRLPDDYADAHIAGGVGGWGGRGCGQASVGGGGGRPDAGACPRAAAARSRARPAPLNTPPSAPPAPPGGQALSTCRCTDSPPATSCGTTSKRRVCPPARVTAPSQRPPRRPPLISRAHQIHTPPRPPPPSSCPPHTLPTLSTPPRLPDGDGWAGDARHRARPRVPCKHEQGPGRQQAQEGCARAPACAGMGGRPICCLSAWLAG